MALPLPNFLDGILLFVLGNFLEGIFFLAVGNFLDGIFAIKPPTTVKKWPAAQRERRAGCHAETQWEGIRCEGSQSTLGIGCVSSVAYFASTNGKMSAMCCMSLEQSRRSSFTAKLMATFPGTSLVCQPCPYFNG